ncbi:MAG TPA: TIGR03986 family CRISPR-associated RAMP protein [bacterium]|nr:TIGR03986 family CRISPR-associated RAMP protein [bacterium]
MNEGIIISFKSNSGEIQGDDGKVYAFNSNAIVNNDLTQVSTGYRVQFQPVGDQARDVKLITYRFLNPYNFVRPMEVHNPMVAPLLGRCAPPPHDRYTGLTGQITCHLTTATPLFVSDSHNIKIEPVNGKDHLHYQFFHDTEGQIAIPGTGLRGVIRSVFEMVTNSCFSNFAENKRLSYHLPPSDALRLVPARVRDRGTKWELELLPGTTTITPAVRPSGPQYAAWVHAYRPLWATSQSSVKVPTSPYARRTGLSLGGWAHKDQCDALVEKAKHPLRHFEFWNVVALAKPGARLPKPTAGQYKVTGYLCITNQNIENKHDERLFFNSGATHLIDLPREVRQRYEELIQDYQERHAAEVEKRKKKGLPIEQPVGKEPGFSRFIVHKQAAELADGDLVYAMLESKGLGFTVKYIVPVSIPRVGFVHNLGQLLQPDDLHHCDEYTQLCPACRTFGWVWNSDDPEQPRLNVNVPAAYAGRVRISHARLVHSAGTFDATLTILSSPKPTTTRFYLRPRSGKPQNGLDDETVSYNTSDQILRGRKVYRHHGARLNEREYLCAHGAKSDQNRTVHNVQNTGAVFEFKVDFENLAEIEFGALLWALEMEGWHHRIGFGKPLGFGSATIQILNIAVLDLEKHYQGLGLNYEMEEKTDKKSLWISIFKKAMQDRFGKDFEKLAAIRDLRSMLADSPSLPIHYPRSWLEPQPEGKNFEWFVGNKRSGKDAGPRLVLPLADEDNVGLPLIDKYGDQK